VRNDTIYLKYSGYWALLLSFIAITAVEFSYVLGGLNCLDSLLFLLVPAFILLVIQIVSTCATETLNYSVAFAILVACITLSLFRLSAIEFGSVGDQYHLMKTVAFSIKNNFAIQFQSSSSVVIYVSDIVESIWGIFWRWTQWDFVIILLQALPIVLVWQQLVWFFQKQNVTAFAGPLATVVVLTLKILWCQQGSPFIDSTVGMFIGIILLLCYSYLTPPYERQFINLAGLVFLSGLCLISKPTGICVAILGLTVAFILGFRYLNPREKAGLSLIFLPSLAYLIYHQIQAQIRTGNIFYPYINNTVGLSNSNYQYKEYYAPLPFHSWVRDHAFNFKPFYILLSWLSDYKQDHIISPAPFYRGNGLVFSYFVIPIFVLWAFQHKNIFKKELWKDPRIAIFIVIFLFYYFFPGSIDARFAVGYNIFILAWCLTYFWQCMESCRNWPKPIPTIIICLMFWMSAYTYQDGILGSLYERKILSPLLIQKEIFPQFETPEIRSLLIQKCFPGHSVKPAVLSKGDS